MDRDAKVAGNPGPRLWSPTPQTLSLHLDGLLYPGSLLPTTKRPALDKGGRQHCGGAEYTPLGTKGKIGIQQKYLKHLMATSALLEWGAKLGPITGLVKRAGGGKAVPIPTLKCPHQPCLAWHLKGGCYSDCTRKAGHVILGDQDIATLCQFIDDGLNKGSNPGDGKVGN